MRGRLIALAIIAGGVICGMPGPAASGAGRTVTIYSSLPHRGALAAPSDAIVQGIRLALTEAGNRAGGMTIRFRTLDDSTAAAGGWDPLQVARNARNVAQDGSAVAYIGDIDTGASAVSIPILNQAGVPQIGPAGTYVGLTTGEPGTAAGEPGRYYPSGQRTYVRIVPRDTLQARALATAMKQDGCQAAGLASDREPSGASLARLLQAQAKAAGVELVGNAAIDGTVSRYRTLAERYKAGGADCFVFTGRTTAGVVRLYRDVAAVLPDARLYGADGVCEPRFTNPRLGGVPASVGRRVRCTMVVRSLSSYPGGKAFRTAYRRKHRGSDPSPYAIYGYEAGRLLVDTIARLGARGADRAVLRAALFATRNRSSVLGRYSFDANGDTSATAYGLYRVGARGTPVFDESIG